MEGLDMVRNSRPFTSDCANWSVARLRLLQRQLPPVTVTASASFPCDGYHVNLSCERGKVGLPYDRGNVCLPVIVIQMSAFLVMAATLASTDELR